MRLIVNTVILENVLELGENGRSLVRFEITRDEECVRDERALGSSTQMDLEALSLSLYDGMFTHPIVTQLLCHRIGRLVVEDEHLEDARESRKS